MDAEQKRAFGTLYYHSYKPRSIAPRVVARMLNLPLNLEHISSAGEAPKEYRQINPLGKIPTLVARDGFTLFECIPILTYLASQSPTTALLGGDNPQNQLLVQQWLSFANAELLPALGGCLARIKGLRVQIRKDFDDCRVALLEVLDAMDEHLQNRTYLVNETLTIADILAVSFISGGFYVFHKYWFGDYPALTRWFKRVYYLPDYEAIAGEFKFLDVEIPEVLQGKRRNGEVREEAEVPRREPAEILRVSSMSVAA